MLSAIRELPVVLSDPETQCELAWELMWSDPIRYTCVQCWQPVTPIMKQSFNTWCLQRSIVTIAQFVSCNESGCSLSHLSEEMTCMLGWLKS